jgi:2-polyprenyl-6-methoxyphenol hydroxylase-like FAD-dependent oxidoreductase
MDYDGFRIIIVGAGPSGLALGNMLAEADIDFIIMERRETVVTDSGACIMVWPHTIRVLDQLSLMDCPVEYSIPLRSKVAINHQGKKLSEDPTFTWIEEK